MGRRGAKRAPAVLAAAATMLAGTAAPAVAAELWVDDGGNDILNGCTFSTNPCDTIAYTINQATMNADATDTIHVGGGAYPEAVTLPVGVSLLKDVWAFNPPFGTAFAATIDGGTLPAVTVPQGLPARSISGNFILRGNDDGTPSEASVYVQSGANPGNVTISGVTFNELGTAGTGIPSQLQIDGGSPKVLVSTFTGVDQNEQRRAIDYNGDGTPEFGGNTITTFFVGIGVDDTAAAGKPAPNIHDNTISEIYDDGMMSAIGAGIRILEGSGQLTGNVIRAKAGQDFTNGISVSAAAPTGTPLTFARNQIYDLPSTSHGIALSTDDPTSFSSDVIANTGVGLSMIGGAGGAIATGLTVTDSTSVVNREVFVSNTALTLNSSFVGDKGVELSGTGSCTSAFSRGPSVPDDCGLTPVADPMFVNPAADDFHLKAGSPLIDTGDPAAPAPGALDVDGGPRAVDATLDCSPLARRDIGADETGGAATLDCVAPDTTATGKKKVKTRKKRRRVSLELGSTEPGASFECSVDDRPFAPCTSPFSTRLRIGRHTIDVLSTDASGNKDATPATHSVRVKRTKPN